jgi:hypothetical protein
MSCRTWNDDIVEGSTSTTQGTQRMAGIISLILALLPLPALGIAISGRLH